MTDNFAITYERIERIFAVTYNKRTFMNVFYSFFNLFCCQISNGKNKKADRINRKKNQKNVVSREIKV